MWKWNHLIILFFIVPARQGLENKTSTLASKLLKELPDLERNSSTKAKSMHDNGLRFRAPPAVKYVYYPYPYPMQPYPQYPPHGYYPPQGYYPPNGYYPPTGRYPPKGSPYPYPYPPSSGGKSAPVNLNILNAKHKVRSPAGLPEPPVAPVAPSPGFGAQNQNVITIVIGKDPK
ncbi:hypothetical protein M5D96_004556 [Drosophila gunungcola]|uniref:CG16743 protein n=1 Tax=Drosophila gunungcola TaxID=103775 RepID=A0A9P9YV24_9MUSC|nr:hypothetical protein M5D96_004556 [Drosophila gunungcola]